MSYREREHEFKVLVALYSFWFILYTIVSVVGAVVFERAFLFWYFFGASVIAACCLINCFYQHYKKRSGYVQSSKEDSSHV
jgi:uncharacterized BrkB/YihY/UPF0761 family membrane protein